MFLGGIATYLATQSLFNEYLLENVVNRDAHPTLSLLLDLFSVNAESTIPTWYSTLLLFAAAVLLGAIAKAKWQAGDRFRKYWLGLTLTFVYLSMDEAAAIHEILAEPLQAIFHPTGYLAFAWQIAAVPLVILFALLFIPFLLYLPPRWRYLFLLSGAIYVTGAVVIDAVSADLWYIDGSVTFTYLAIGTVEEFLEMTGMALFIFTLLSYMAESQLTYLFDFAPQRLTADLATESPSNTDHRPVNLRRIVIPALTLILIVNSLFYFEAASTQSGARLPASESETFYQKVINEYSGQGFVVLRINESFTPGNPAAKQAATSVLVLFDDVIVVSLPEDNYSIAFAGSKLPFNKDDLKTILLDSGDKNFSILDSGEIKTFAQGDQ